MQLALVRLVLGNVANNGSVALQRSLDKPPPRMKRRRSGFVEHVLASCGPSPEVVWNLPRRRSELSLKLGVDLAQFASALAATHCKTTLVRGCLIHSSIWRRVTAVVIGDRSPLRGPFEGCSAPSA